MTCRRVLLFAFIGLVMILSGGCSDDSCDVAQSDRVRDFVASQVDSGIDGIVQVKLTYDSKGYPVISAIRNWETIDLYHWDGEKWNRYNVISDTIICDADFVELDDGEFLYVIAKKDSNNSELCRGEEVVFNTRNSARSITPVDSMGNIRFLDLKKFSDESVRLAFLDEDSLYLYYGFRKNGSWYIDLVDRGSDGGVGYGNIFYAPVLLEAQSGDAVLVYYELKKPEIKIAALSQEDLTWHYQVVPINTTDIEVTPDFDAFLTSWGGVGISFRNAVDNQLYYAFEVTGWEIGRITSGEGVTGFVPNFLPFNDGPIVIYYDFSYEQLRYAVLLPEFYNDFGLKVRPWREDVLPFSGAGIYYDAAFENSGESWFGVAYFDSGSKILKYYEVLK